MSHDIGGESARFLSDGLNLHLENGRTVRPRLKTPAEQEPFIVTWSDPEAGEIGLGPDIDDTRVVMYLSPAKAVFDDEGERVYHYEWNGWFWCDREDEAFEYDTGDVTCPHCDDTFVVPEPVET